MTRKTGGPAFPLRVENHTSESVDAFGSSVAAGSFVQFSGMTLRDYFAAQELSKMNAVACCDIPDAYARQAEHCYRMADAMLEARTK